MGEFEIEVESQKESVLMESNLGKKLVTITTSIILGAFVIYLIYAIMFAVEYGNNNVITLAGEKTDTLYNTTMAAFSNASNLVFIVGFFALGLSFIATKKSISKRKKTLTAAGVFATLSVLFGVVAIFVMYYRDHYLQTITSNFIDYMLAVLQDDILLATGPIADVGKFLFVAIALILVGFSVQALDYKKKPKVKVLVTPWLFFVSVLLWISLLVSIYIYVINYTPDLEETLRALFLTTNINQCFVAASGFAAVLELLIKIRKTKG